MTDTKEELPPFRILRTTAFYKKENRFGPLTHTAGVTERPQYLDKNGAYRDFSVEHEYLDLK